MQLLRDNLTLWTSSDGAEQETAAGESKPEEKEEAPAAPAAAPAEAEAAPAS
jgi:14-3-3 protein epsilon